MKNRGQRYEGYLIGKPMPLDQLVGLGFRIPVRTTRPQATVLAAD